MSASVFTTPKRRLTFLVTGSSSGFGLSLVRIAQAAGHNVIATSRNPGRTPDLVQEIESKGGKWLALDVTDKDSGRLIDRLEAEGAHIDVLFNNAGWSLFAPIETATEQEVRDQMEVVYFGPIRLIRAALPHMRRRRFGVVVNMSSGASLEGQPSMGAYAGAKAGLDGLTKVLAKEVAAFNIRTLTVVAGTFNTNFGNVAPVGQAPLPDDYSGSVVEKYMEFMKSGAYDHAGIINGDKDLAMKTLYEVIVAEGQGAGKEAQKLLPLGKDACDRVNTVRTYLEDSLLAFGDMARSVALPGK